MTDLSNPIYHDEDAAREHLESIRWPDGPFCPYCGEAEQIKPLMGKSMGPGWYHCNSCRKKFTVRVGTVYERSHVPLYKWVMATHLLCASKKGISSHQLHRMLGVTYKTAWFMTHRIREAMKDPNPGPMGGKGKVIEADETFIGHSAYVFTNRYGWKPKPGSQYKVVSLVERGGPVRSFKVDRIKSRDIRNILVKNADRNSVLSTDEARHYTRVGKEFKRHWTVNHGEHEYASGMASTNTIEGFFSIFKRGMKGVYQHCGEQHLQRYLTEFDFRYNTRDLEDWERAAKALQGIEGKRLTYRRAG